MRSYDPFLSGVLGRKAVFTPGRECGTIKKYPVPAGIKIKIVYLL